MFHTRSSRFMILLLMGISCSCGVSPRDHESSVRSAFGTRYLFYLHGKIIEDQGLEARSERYGAYDYAGIVKALGDSGFIVLSEARPPGTDPFMYAKAVSERIRNLLREGVRAEQITVVGASKGAAIAVLISHMLSSVSINYVLLATCSSKLVEYWNDHTICMSGRVLSVFDSSDHAAGSCQSYLMSCPGVTEYAEIIVNTGLGHGLLYKPLSSWMTPAVRWARGES